MKHADRYTNGEYLDRHPTWHAEDSPWKARQVLKILERNRVAAKSIAEVGCGAGEILKELHAVLPGEVEFAGFEISPHAFALCLAKQGPRLKFYLADILSRQDAFFDVVLCIDLIEHLEDCYGFLRGLKNKATYKIFHIPLTLSVQGVMRMSAIIADRREVGHINCFSKEIALATLKDTEYRIIDYFYTPNGIELKTDSIKRRLAMLPRSMFFRWNQDLTVRFLGGFSLMILAE